ncbi:MAG: glycosyltransferase family 2 protein [Patescibacteria group bacterium]
MSKLTTIILTKNEERNIELAIKSAAFSDQIIVVDAKSSDKTQELAIKFGAEVISDDYKNFSKQREAGLRQAKGDFVFYLDADERISPKLKEEIENVLKDEFALEVYKIGRQNIYFWKYKWPNIAKLERLFKKDALKGWRGEIHESPMYDGKVGELSGLIIHYTHNDLTSMTNKTIEWSQVEAQIRIDAKHPAMTWWRFPRVMVPAFFNYFLKQKGYKLGTAGFIESMFQAFSTFITYAKLWEMQNKDRKT